MQHKNRVMRVKKTLPGLVLGMRATALPPLMEDPAELKGQALAASASKKQMG